MVFYYCPSLESVKELLAMAIQQLCPCADDVLDSASSQWIQLLSKKSISKLPTGDSSSSSSSRTSPSTVVSIPIGGRTAEVSVTNNGKVQHRLTATSNIKSNNPSSGGVAPVVPSSSIIQAGQLSSNLGHDSVDTPSIIKDDLSGDSYVIQVEPIRDMAASPSSILGGADSWASDESSTAHRTMMTIKAEVDSWTRRVHQQSIDNSNAESGGISAVVPNRRSLRHAASHPSSRDADAGSCSSSGPPSSVSKRRLDWRNSHRNYRSAPTTAASRDSYAAAALQWHDGQQRRTAPLRDYPHSVEVASSSVYPASVASLVNRRMLPKRGGSMRETMGGGGQDVLLMSSSSCSSSMAAVDGGLPQTAVAQQRCQMMASPATKRWRCHTIDCPCSNNVSASCLVNQDRILDASLISSHRHSYPSSEDLASPSISSSRRLYQRSEDTPPNLFGGRTKEAFYEDYLNRSEGLDWNDFQIRTQINSNKRDEVESVIDDDGDGTDTQLQTPAGPAPRITIRYNDTGSLESDSEDNLFYCLEAGTKNEFRQRLEKTIHAQYRQVWELRANLEEQTDFYEPSSPEPEAIINPAISELGSFDSNPESLMPEDERHPVDSPYGRIPSPPESISLESKASSMLLPVVSSSTGSSWKRQSYRSVAINSRLRRQNDPAGPIQLSPQQQQPQSSFDSIDTIETSSTEASRMDHVTTSFESSATDSTTGAEVTIQPSVSHRMLALRNDSGYRSQESAVIPAPRLTKALATTASLSQDDLQVPTSSANVPAAAAQSDHSSSPATAATEQCQCRSQVLHDEKCERYKPIIFARCTRYGMKGRSASASTPHSSGWKTQQKVHQHHSQQSLARDYSIDERTDALFREFSRCDPVYDGSRNFGGSRMELRPTSFSHRSRWINQHQRHDSQHHYQHRFTSFQEASSHPLASDASDSLLQHCTLKE